MTHENFLQSTGQVPPGWAENRRLDIEFTHALLRVAKSLLEPDRRTLIAGLVVRGLATLRPAGTSQPVHLPDQHRNKDVNASQN